MYQPIHLKYRPETLADLIGQEHIVRTLHNAIAQNKIAPAYLFAGARGTGKTSTARILAKSLNCHSANSPTTQPCGKCNSCRAIALSNSLDVTELDAASKSGVDSTRDIIEKLGFATVESRYKIVIIDECHALSSAAWQSLLKTIEQPPAHVVFILCTTEAHKVPDTISSRSHWFDFHTPSIQTIVSHLALIAEKEEIKVTESALRTIAQSKNKHMRDCQTLLDQLSNLDTEITANWVWEITGLIPEYDLLTILENLSQGNAINSIKILKSNYEFGKSPFNIYTDLVRIFKDLLIAKASGGENLTEREDDTWKELVNIACTWEIKHIQSAISLVSSKYTLMRDNLAHLWLETTLIELAQIMETKTKEQPWANWKTIQDAINWSKEKLPHLSQSELEVHWNNLTPINGKKAPAWVQMVQKLQIESRLETA
ncbi:DNA polymerase III subunit gamma/tau [Iningainema tapete]|uniref:DNA polymerase III subunit gamma/tau n=1 Tax=Iningainema tapete BLCC-T55 TaxID=2748662 RepID=A0A8J6XR40_9CYAN|nr:DNA polymerase III subunit gamma/tau [Iningainema tapete]MBD2772033.1 DNA polymerase III subunit gamma/tau [Iningainema tapete BLCC-T55]